MSQDKQDDDGAAGVVKLTRDQIEICRVLGLTLEQYARAMIMGEQDAENKENHNE